MSAVAIIPARGGSVRVPRKNIRNFCGKPMLAWSLLAAQQSGCFERIIVSTDDEEIAKIAKQYGAEVPFIRPANLADDYANTSEVITHAIGELKAANQAPEYVCCLYATAPFLQAEDVRQGWQILQQGEHDYVFAITSYAFPIQRALKYNKQQHLQMFMPEHEQTRSQDLEAAYHDAGQFYWAKADTWLNGASAFNGNAKGVLLPRHRAQDIDTPEDWQQAELMFKALHKAQA